MARREQWIDAARGTALAFVVLFHVNGQLRLSGFAVSEHLRELDSLLDGFRMPTLLMVSGLLAVGVRTWSWADVLRRRVGPLLLLYLIWATIILVAITVIRGGIVGHLGQPLVLAFVRPYGPVWYLAALAAYIALARALRSVPTLVLAPIAVALSVVSYAVWPHDAWALGMNMWLYLTQHWVFFLFAERFSASYLGVVARTRPALALAVGAAFVGVGALAWNLGYLEGPGHVRSAVPAFVITALGTAVSLTLFPLVCRLRGMRWSVAVGRRSLGVYATHLMIVLAVIQVFAPALGDLHAPGIGIVVPIAVAAVALAASYGLTALILRFAPVPLLRPWWSTKARAPREVPAPAE